MEIGFLCASQYLNKHLILNYKKNVRACYMSVVEYFVDCYAQNNLYSNQLLKLYKKIILNNELHEGTIKNTKDLKKSIRVMRRGKMKRGDRANRFRALLFDCFYIAARDNKDVASVIAKDFENMYGAYKYLIQSVYDALYSNENKHSVKGIDMQLYCWKINHEHMSKPLQKILITANMSAGKSTLINALVGKRVNKTQNDSCTSKIHYIYNKPFEDGFVTEWDGELELNADLKTLMEDNPSNLSTKISVGAYYNTSVKTNKRLCIVDTPGVNSALDTEHREMSYKVITDNQYDIVACVLNASNIGTYDDIKHLEFLAKNVKDKKVVFIINQLDKFDNKNDSIEECMSNVLEDIKKIGFKNYCLCPVSAYAALLAKKYLDKEQLNEIEKMELHMFYLKFQENYEVMRKYFANSKDIIMNNEDSLENKCKKLLVMSGLENVEQVLFK